MKKILGLFLVFALLISACGGGGGGATTGAANASPTVTNDAAKLAGKMFSRTWSIPLSNTTTTVDCTGLISYASNGTYHEDSNLYVNGALTSSGSRDGTWSLLSDGTFTTTDTAGSVAETTIAKDLGEGTFFYSNVSCSDGDRYAGYTFKRVAVVDSSGNLTVRTKRLDMTSWKSFYKLDSTNTSSLADTYVLYKTGQNPGFNTWQMNADGTGSISGTMSVASWNWTESAGTMYLSGIVATAGSSNLDWTHGTTSWSTGYSLVDESVIWTKQ